MRGKRIFTFPSRKFLRITPAHAGKTLVFDGETVVGGDHPRACGENFSAYRSLFALAGSPPRMRGKLFTCNVPFMSVRITPAHAGKTITFVSSIEIVRDHPRACGENCRAS